MGSYDVQSDDGETLVRVNAGTYRQTGRPQTDFIIAEAGYPDDHRHIAFDEFGNLAYDGYNANR